jgi:hypothetical protein
MSHASYLGPAQPVPPGYTPRGHGRPLGKVRSPFGVWCLTLITFGVYFFVWLAKVSRETRDFAAPHIQVNPAGVAWGMLGWPALSIGVGVVGIAVGAAADLPAVGIPLLILGYVGAFVIQCTMFSRVGTRIRTAQQFGELEGTCSNVTGVLLHLIVFGTGICYYQSELNKLWRAYGAR